MRFITQFLSPSDFPVGLVWIVALGLLVVFVFALIVSGGKIGLPGFYVVLNPLGKGLAGLIQAVRAWRALQPPKAKAEEPKKTPSRKRLSDPP